ncbi:unnamed protein product [Urochloa decumbens]|uniref:KIB1-4 beta-propeller domain-containing protein n=1 Tax=Urochloa decumbens TaxID=240449 RepID=A0ABC9ARV5_9POAL
MPPRAPWSEIPLDLAGLVLGRLPAHADRVRFAGACRRWRAAAREVPVPPPMPLLVLPDGTLYSLPMRKPFRLPAGSFAAACGNWLLFSGKDDGGGSFLRNPMSNATVRLPALHRVRRLYKKQSSDGSLFTYQTNDDASKNNLAVRRLLLCSPDLVVLQLQGCYEPGEGRGILYGSQRASRDPGAGSWWSVCMDDLTVPILAAMALHEGTLFAVERYTGKLYAIDIGVDESTGDPWVSRFRLVIDSVPSCPSSTIPHGHGHRIMEPLFCLAESRGALLMVRRQMYDRLWSQRDKLNATGLNEFQVFEADLQASCWTKVATIGDGQVLFLSGDHCRSLSVSKHGMPGDRIVFFEDDNEIRSWYEESTSSCSVYDMRDSKISAFFPTALHWKRGTVCGTWLFPEEPSETVTTST